MTPELADAWEKFSNMIIQEFIYDMWWGALSPDTHFPALVRELLNNAAACLVTRAKEVDLNHATIHIVHSLAVRPFPPAVGAKKPEAAALQTPPILQKRPILCLRISVHDCALLWRICSDLSS
jgi:hypothetical protein